MVVGFGVVVVEVVVVVVVGVVGFGVVEVVVVVDFSIAFNETASIAISALLLDP